MSAFYLISVIASSACLTIVVMFLFLLLSYLNFSIANTQNRKLTSLNMLFLAEAYILITGGVC